MNKRDLLLLFLVSIGVLFSLSSCRTEFLAPRIDVGTAKDRVLKRLGEPDEINTLTKSTEYIWGPIESWWDALEMGDQIEIWVYHYDSGTYQLYFLNDSDQVGFEVFIEKGVVY